jgi:hypothetical protein
MGKRDRPSREERKPKKDTKTVIKTVISSAPVEVLRTKGKKQVEE